MRLRIVVCLFTAALAAVMFGPASNGQFKGGGRQKGGFGGKMDPSRMFDFMARGKPSIVIAEMRPGGLQTSLMEYAKEKGIANGEISREQFTEFGEYMKAKMSGGPTGAPSKPGDPSAPPTPGGPAGPAGGASLETMQQFADADFKSHDANGDGKLVAEEMPGALRRDLAKWDTNNDGMIDLNEYRGYFITRMQERMAGGPGGQPQVNPIAALIEEDLDRRPVVLRAGKLPTKGLPDWFKKLDTDNDGQVALYEWRQAGKDLSEFKDWDRDNDGFITPEEALHANAVLTKSADPLLAGSSTGSLSTGASAGSPSAFSPGGPRGFGGPKGNQGGKKRGPPGG